jgi:hypothetical protein
MEFRTAAEDAELGKGAGTDPEILSSLGSADLSVFGRMHLYLSRCAGVRRGTRRAYRVAAPIRIIDKTP